MKFDVMGRIRNMDLPDGKTAVLYSVYEAVSNSIHAINDRFGEDDAATLGSIKVEIELDDDLEVDSITVSDNGVGFNPDNLSSFETSDSSYKYTRGGKGVGRLVWIKTFKDIKVSSRYVDGDEILQNKFEFKPELDQSIANYRSGKSKKTEPGSVIKISNPRGNQGGRMNQATFMKDLALHFFALFITNTLPEIELVYNGESRRLREFIEDKTESPFRTTLNFDVDGDPWEIHMDHIYVDPNISKELRNSYLLTAHGRLVGDPISVERKYALKDLPDGKAYVSVVSGKPLDDRVDQQRLGFRFNNAQKEALEQAVLEGIEHFLARATSHRFAQGSGEPLRVFSWSILNLPAKLRTSTNM